jgi:hypothetical protein
MKDSMREERLTLSRIALLAASSSVWPAWALVASSAAPATWDTLGTAILATVILVPLLAATVYRSVQVPMTGWDVLLAANIAALGLVTLYSLMSHGSTMTLPLYELLATGGALYALAAAFVTPAGRFARTAVVFLILAVDVAAVGPQLVFNLERVVIEAGHVGSIDRIHRHA